MVCRGGVLVYPLVVLTLLGIGCATEEKFEGQDWYDKEESLRLQVEQKREQERIAAERLNTASHDKSLDAAARDAAVGDAVENYTKATEALKETERKLDEHRSRPADEYLLIRNPYVVTSTWGEFKYILDPGFFDVGLGVGSSIDAIPDEGSDDDLIGFAVVLKAYPFGRWWAAVPVPGTQNDHGGPELITITDDFVPSLLRRFSFAAGLSIGDLAGADTGRDIKTPAFLAGVSYDLAPQFSVLVGISVVQTESDIMGGGKERELETALYVGVMLNGESLLALLGTTITDTGRKPRDLPPASGGGDSGGSGDSDSGN